MTVKTTFAFEGTHGGKHARIAWTEGEGFDDPLGLTGALIATGEEVCSTVTGPCYTAADTPPLVAWLTAVRALETITSVDDPMGVWQQVQDEAVVPPGAVA